MGRARERVPHVTAKFVRTRGSRHGRRNAGRHRVLEPRRVQLDPLGSKTRCHRHHGTHTQPTTACDAACVAHTRPSHVTDRLATRALQHLNPLGLPRPLPIITPRLPSGLACSHRIRSITQSHNRDTGHLRATLASRTFACIRQWVLAASSDA